ncbi:ABC-2 transporter permease [Desulfolucanica intricata]|uniref:ABC-2 transporter permease n=1 Tax=Desulfolucanica intricata TaxID=1285191 RepID=UPI0008344DFD|nr:ABC-2 transporter permease [Desulfolucanica intricata]
MLVLTACAYDDKNKADVLLNSLPVKRSSIVLARYISIFVYIVIGTAAYLVTTTFISLIGFPVKNCPVSLEGLAGGLFSISLITGIYLPFYYKLGYIKSRSLNFILFFTFFFGITSTVNYLFKNRDTAWVQNIMSFFQSLSNLRIFALLACLVLIMLTVSYTLSLKAYQSRDF